MRVQRVRLEGYNGGVLAPEGVNWENVASPLLV